MVLRKKRTLYTSRRSLSSLIFFIFRVFMDVLFDANDAHMNGIADPFVSIGIDPNDQTGSDWYNLMLSASLGGQAVHGVTFAATCETLAKKRQEFAAKHAVGRIHYNEQAVSVPHASDEWDEKNLTGRAFHGTKTGNKSRMLFDTGEWEPSIRTRAKNAAIAGALLVNSGSTMEEATEIMSAEIKQRMSDEMEHGSDPRSLRIISKRTSDCANVCTHRTRLIVINLGDFSHER